MSENALNDIIRSARNLRRAVTMSAPARVKFGKEPVEMKKATGGMKQGKNLLERSAPINKAPTERLDVYVMGEDICGELGLGHEPTQPGKPVQPVMRPRLNPLLDRKSVGVVDLACGGMHAIALTHGTS